MSKRSGICAASAKTATSKGTASGKTTHARNSSAQNDDPMKKRTRQNAVVPNEIAKEQARERVDNEGESSQELAPKQSAVGGAAEEKEQEEEDIREDIDSDEENTGDDTDKERDVVEVPGVQLTVKEKDIIAARRVEKAKWRRKLEGERAQEAKTRNDANGWPMPESKTEIAEMTKEERMSVGLRFPTKLALISRLMAISEHDKKRFLLSESRPLSVVGSCPFAGTQGCPFELRVGFRSKAVLKAYHELTFEDKLLSAADRAAAVATSGGGGGGGGGDHGWHCGL